MSALTNLFNAMQKFQKSEIPNNSSPKKHRLQILAGIAIIATLSGRANSQESEIQLLSIQDFKNIESNPFGKFSLDADVLWTSNSETFKPFPFYGSLKGNGHTIHIPKITCNENSPCGLFTLIANDSSANCGALAFQQKQFKPQCVTDRQAEITNLHVIVDTIYCTQSCGVLAGEISRAKIQNIIISGNVFGGSFVGGVAGKAGPFVEVNRIFTSGTISGINFIGGVFGSSFWNIINAAYSNMDISGRFSVGGCIGRSNSSYSLHLISTGNIKGQDTVGGILGVSVGTNRGKSAITLNADYSNIPGSFRSIDDLADFSYKTNHPWESGNYSGYTYEGESDWPTLEEEWSEPKPNTRSASKLYPDSSPQSFDEEWVSKIALDNRLIDAVFLGTVKCRNVCGGIRGAGVSKSLALAHALNSGYILASGRKSGQISGTASDEMPQFNILQSGKLLGTRPFRAFGETAIGVACGIQFPLFPNITPKTSDIFGSIASDQRYSARGISWYPEVYPKGIFIAKPNKTTFSFSSAGLPVLKDLDASILVSNSRGFNFIQDQDSTFMRLPMYLESNDYFWRRYLPPIPIRAFEKLAPDKCINLNDYFDANQAITFKILSNQDGLKMSNSILCSELRATKGEIDIQAKKKDGGQLIFSINTK
ncbi:MAG TPA: hypothetical protein PKO15_17725 [Fibrobacteria bacterium]|nr:hypothetical protein [Fibrobacteria bacterium]